MVVSFDPADRETAANAVGTLLLTEPDPDTKQLHRALRGNDADVTLDATGMGILLSALSDEHRFWSSDSARSLHQRIIRAMGAR